jgi:mRNA interferase RelE/StbE
MTYEISWSESAFLKLAKLDSRTRKRIVEKLEETAEDPFISTKRLTGANLYSLRVGDYRVIMSIEKGRIVILVLDVGHRSAIYKNL